MKRATTRFLLILLCLLCRLAANAQLPDIPDSLLNTEGVTLQQLTDYMDARIPEDDSDEGGPRAQLQTFKTIWGIRASRNESATVNMFQQYMRGWAQDMAAKGTSVSCSGTAFSGNWRSMGPLEMPTQNLAFVNCIWTDPANPNYSLAGTVGGLFKTTDGGANWECITDKAPVKNSATGIAWIAVNPLRKNTIYLGTKTSFSDFQDGSAILKSFDGGVTWEQELIPISSTSFDNEVTAITKVVFTPDTLRLYAFSRRKIYTRLNNSSTPGTWTNVTPGAAHVNVNYVEFEFDPGDQKHFFVGSMNAGNNTIDYMAEVWEGRLNVTTGVIAWNNISNAVSVTVGSNVVDKTNFGRWAIAMPNSQYLYAWAYSGNGSPLLRYNTSTMTWQTLNQNLYNYFAVNPSFLKHELEVSPANPNNIYAASDQVIQSIDGGASFRRISTYGGTPTHADIRGMLLYSATTSLRGKDDILFFASDGGVGKKPSNVDAWNVGESASININGKGLAAGEFWGVSVSEVGGLVLGGMMHDGIVGFEPTKTPKWKTLEISDAYVTMFDKTDKKKAYALDGFGGLFRQSTVPNTAPGGRDMDALTWDTYPPLEAHEMPPMLADNANTHYASMSDVWRKTAAAASFSRYGTVTTFGGPGGIANPAKVRDLAISSPTTTGYNGYVLYSDDKIYYRNGVTASTPFAAIPYMPGAPTWYHTSCITTDPGNTSRVWVGVGGFNYNTTTPTHNRVYYSANKGGSGSGDWVDVSKGLPMRVAIGKIIYQEGMNMLYAATDVGIWRCDFSKYNPALTSNGYNASVEWTCFNKGAAGEHDFPNEFTTSLFISYCEGKLYASTYGRSVWSTELLVEDPNYNMEVGDVVPEPTDIITSNTTYNTSKYINAGIRVKSGNTLTISGTNTVIYMPKNGAIIVEAGAKLIVDGARITNDCNYLWKGILVLGNKSQQQTITGGMSNQGFAVIRNQATIEHARLGVANYGESVVADWGASAGGIIQADDSKFLNNARGAGFAPYHNNAGEQSYIRKCKFIVNNDYRGETTQYAYQTGISMSDVDGLYIKGNEFENASTLPNTQNKGCGIMSWNGGFNVVPTCPSGTGCPESQYIYNTFKGFNVAISSGGDVTNSRSHVFVDFASFDKNAIGVYVNNVNQFDVFRSSFDLYHNGPSYNSSCNCLKGIFAVKTPLFRIERNKFTGHILSSSNASNSQTYGTYIDGSAENSNDVYGNSFTNLDWGSFVIGRNTNFTTDPALMVGLQLLCNSYTNNGKGIFIDPTPGVGNSSQGVRYWQGTPQSPAGNTFIPVANTNYATYSAAYANNCRWLNYYYNQPAEHVNPLNITPIQIATSIQCPVRAIVTPNGTPYYLKQNLKDAVTAASTAVKTNVQLMRSYIDGGSTSDLLNEVENTTSDGAMDLYRHLQDIVPYVSEAVLRSIAENEKLPVSMMLDVLAANPDVLTPSFIGYLQSGIPNPYSDESISLLTEYAAANTVTSRTNLLTDIANNYHELSLAANDLMLDLKTDTVANPTDTIARWYHELPFLWSRYAEAMMFLRENPEKAQGILALIPEEFTNLTTDESNEYGSYVDLVNLLATAVNADGDFTLTDDQLVALKAIADMDHGFASQTALSIYNRNMNIEDLPCIVSGDSSGSAVVAHKGNSGGATINRTTDSKISVYPNPAREFINFDYYIPTAGAIIELTIVNISGQVVLSRKLDKRQSQIWVDTRHFSSGTYLYKFSNGKKTYLSGKFSVTK